MKTKFPTLQFSALFPQKFAIVMLVFGLLTIGGFTSASAANIMQFEATPFAQTGFDFTATLTLPSPMPAGTVAAAMPSFYGLEGFENADLDAELINSGTVLLVTLSGVSGENLPANTSLGSVTLTNASGVITFRVRTDDGSVVVIDADF
jgi:hypothetical protein